MKVVINTCYGGFGLSNKAKARYLDLAGKEPVHWYDMNRADKHLIQVVEGLGREADGPNSKLKVVNVEAGRWFRIKEYDGYEEIEYRDIDDSWTLATE
jgi:hypothetical protein